MDTAEVKIYRQTGPSPDPANDILLGIDTTFDAGGGWTVGNTLGEGRYTIYAVGYDLAGNESSFTQRHIDVLPDPMRVSGLVAWTLGEMKTVKIGAFSS